MTELKIDLPTKLEGEIKDLPADRSKFILEAVEEKLAEIRLEKSKAFRKLLSKIFDRMTENSKLSDEDCLRLGREVNKVVATKYGLIK